PAPALQHSFLFSRSCRHRALHSFPTRRSSDLATALADVARLGDHQRTAIAFVDFGQQLAQPHASWIALVPEQRPARLVLPLVAVDRKSTRLNSSHVKISYAVFCLKKKKKK